MHEVLKQMRETKAELEAMKKAHGFEEDSWQHHFLEELKKIEENFELEDDKVREVMKLKETNPNYNWIDVKQI